MAIFGIDAGAVKRRWQRLRAAGPRSLLTACGLLLLAFIVVTMSWRLPILGNAERLLYDLRYSLTAPSTGQDQRIQLIVYDDNTLIETGKRTPLDRRLLVEALRNIDGFGARAIGIDILLRQRQDEDDELKETLRAMQTPTYLSHDDGRGEADFMTYEQREFHNGFFRDLDDGTTRPVNARLEDEAGVVRNWPQANSVSSHPQIVAALVAGEDVRGAADGGAILYQRQADPERPVLSPLRIDLFANAELAESLRSQIEGRYILIGSDISDYERFRTPLSGESGEDLSSTEIHATMLAQALDNGFHPRLPFAAIVLIGLFVGSSAVLWTVAEARMLPGTATLVLQVAIVIGLPFLLQAQGMDTLGMPALGWLFGWIIAFIAASSAVRASGAEERRFAQSALGKYLPRDIAQEIIDNPERLSLSGSRHEIFIMFSDLEGFTGLSEQLEPEQVARLLNDYLDRLSDVVLEHGGIIDKYVGDAVVAFWGAPIARPEDGRNAAEAAYALWKEGERFRRMADPDLPPIGRTRVGLHHGAAIVGNFGGERRIQYTALGDAMNTAARLEAANKALGTNVLASLAFAEASGVDWWRPMGSITLRGKAAAIEIFDAAPEFDHADRAALAEALAIMAGDRRGALARVEAIAGKYPDDLALQNMLSRLGAKENE